MSPDEAEFRHLYAEAFPTVYRVVYRFSGRREPAEDATQEAFARVFERWGRLGGEPWVVGWIVTTALNVVRRSARRTAEELLGSGSGSGKEPSSAEDVEGAVDLWRAIRELPRRQAEAIVLHYIIDLPVAQVADVMGCRDGTAKAHLDRGRRRLARLLEPSEAPGKES